MILMCCTAAGLLAGLCAGAIASAGPAHGAREQNQDSAFAMPVAPPKAAAEAEDAAAVDPRILRSWEATARQPLPPRKEPLTPPGWKIVGVTIAGKERNVLILFDNQKTTELRKIGDALPGGAKIVQISQDELQLALNGQLMKLSLHKQ